MPIRTEITVVHTDADGDMTTFSPVPAGEGFAWQFADSGSYIAEEDVEDFLEACIAAVRSAKAGA